MHVPDGFLDGKTLAAAAALSACGLGAALWDARRLPPRRVPLMGLSAAFVFAGQMLNFPVAGGTSGHLIGGVLTAVLLGPSAAILVLTAVLVLQCLLFADGGLLALGANVLNMGVIDSVGGYLIYRTVARLLPGARGKLTAVAFAAWCGAVLAALACSGELVASGTARANVVLPAMVGVHMLIGLGEAVITALVIATVWRSRPELLQAAGFPPAADPDAPSGFDVIYPPGVAPHLAQLRVPEAAAAEGHRPGLRSFLAYGLLVALSLAIFVSPFASKLPDGLDRVAENLGFNARATEHAAPISDYHLPGIAHERLATAGAGVVGTLIAFAAAAVLARMLVPRRTGGAAREVAPPDPGAPLPPAATP